MPHNSALHKNPASNETMQSKEKNSHEFFVRCAGGLENLLAEELKQLGLKRVRLLTGGVAFFGSFEDAYRVCLWSRVASRVLFIVKRIEASDADSLYKGVQQVDWTEHIGAETSIAIHAHGTNENLRNTQFIAVRVKDALCDQLRSKRGSRPNVQQNRPDVLLDVVLRGNKATLSIDFSGEPLHRRGYREDKVQSEAPLKENLAAGIVLASGWNEGAAQGATFLDPLCGSGTLAIEAALIAAQKAPGLLRDYWGFTGWQGFDEAVWEKLLNEAQELANQTKAKAEALQTHEKTEQITTETLRTKLSLPHIFASDLDKESIALARKNAARAGVAELIEFSVLDVADLQQITSKLSSTGVLVSNPPYGQRLLSSSELPQFYASLAQGIESLDDGWDIALITPDEALDSALGLSPFDTLPFYNGKIETKLRRYHAGDSHRVFLDFISLQGKEHRLAVTERNSEQFALRLRKIAKERMKWAKKHDIKCYRIYDADLPDYVVAIDRYEGSDRSEGEHYILVSEYKAPAEIDSGKAQRRFDDVLKIIPLLLDTSPEHVIAKTRKREKGGEQYQEKQGNAKLMQTREAGYTLELDVNGYLDTGLFLDHRLTREMLGTMASGKRFLNLFAYTGVATVHAAGGGALSTKTVDLSQTYLSWARRNMALNGFTGSEHSYERADITQWVEEEAARGNLYDLIFVDPPTFSNSKSMKEASWSVQRDHVKLLASCKELLAEGATIVFSCNLRSFKPDTAALERAGLCLKDISAQTIPHDFERNPKIHRCYLVSRL